jgi:hypothetical protein
MASPKAVRVELSEDEQTELQARLRRRKIARSDALRAEIVLLAADGLSNLAITERLGAARMTVATWRGRFVERRLDGLSDEPRPGAPRTVTDAKVAEVVTATLETLPTGRTYWSSRGMAKTCGQAAYRTASTPRSDSGFQRPEGPGFPGRHHASWQSRWGFLGFLLTPALFRSGQCPAYPSLGTIT